MTAGRAAGDARRPTSHLRWWIIVAACAGNAINYLDRANLGVAVPFMSKELHLGTVAVGYALGAFFFTYAPALLLMGYLVDRWGARVVGGVAVAIWSVFSGLTSVVQTGTMLIGLRLLLGLGESGAYPAWVKALAEWFPRQERALGTIIYDNGARIGSTAAIPLITVIIAAVGWRASFALTALLGLLWIPLWVWLCRRPREHPRVSAAELRHIEAGGARQDDEQQGTAAPAQVRWIDLLRYRSTWGMVLGLFGNGCVVYFFITWFPTYLIDVRHFTLLKLGLLGALPGLCAIGAGFLGGLVADWLVKRGVSLTVARKSCIVGGSAASAVIALTAFTDSAVLALVLLSLSYGCVIFANGSIWALPADLAPVPSRVASLAMIMDFGGMIGALVFPISIGYMVALNGGSFRLPLVVTGALAIVSALAFGLIVGRVEPLPLPGRRPAAGVEVAP